MPRRQTLLIVIADGEHARFVRRASATGFVTDRQFNSASAHKRSSDLRSDGPGASFHTGSTAHHALEPRHDPHEQEKHAFDVMLAGELNAMRADAFDCLILVAPSHTLNSIRERLAPEVAVRLVGTVAKDLVKVPDAELWPHLKLTIPPGTVPPRDQD